MAGGLTPKQEAFAQAYVETGNASEAYRRAYEADDMKMATVNREAKVAIDNHKIAARVAELQDEAKQRHIVTVDDLAEMLREDRKFARDLENPAAAGASTERLGKLYGLFAPDKHDVAVRRYEVTREVRNG